MGLKNARKGGLLKNAAYTDGFRGDVDVCSLAS
jgi:hypothetical protein